MNMEQKHDSRIGGIRRKQSNKDIEMLVFRVLDLWLLLPTNCIQYIFNLEIRRLREDFDTYRFEPYSLLWRSEIRNFLWTNNFV